MISQTRSCDWACEDRSAEMAAWQHLVCASLLWVSGCFFFFQTGPYDWACKGPSAEMAGWQHLVLEAGQDDKPGMGRTTAPPDMTKCFEQVWLWHVWRWGCHWGFPRALLRIILLVFSFQRRVGLWGSVSQPVTTHAAIIAGSVFSCAILHILFIWPCDCLMSEWHRLRLTKYVDDLTISATEE